MFERKLNHLDFFCFLGSDIQRVCSMAIRKWLRKKVCLSTSNSQQQNCILTTADLKECIKTVKPLNENWRKKFETWVNTNNVL